MFLFLLVLGAAACSSVVVAQGPACPGPFSPLLMFADPEDVEQIFAGGLDSEFGWRSDVWGGEMLHIVLPILTHATITSLHPSSQHWVLE